MILEDLILAYGWPLIIRGHWELAELLSFEDIYEFLESGETFSCFDHTWAHFIPIRKGATVGEFGEPGYFQADDKYKDVKGSFPVTILCRREKNER